MDSEGKPDGFGFFGTEGASSREVFPGPHYNCRCKLVLSEAGLEKARALVGNVDGDLVDLEKMIADELRRQVRKATDALQAKMERELLYGTSRGPPPFGVLQGKDLVRGADR